MSNDNLEITALIGSFDGSGLEGIEPRKEGEDFFFPAIESAKRLGYHNPRDAIRRHCMRETKTVDEIVVTGKRKDGSDAVQVIHRKYICEADFYRLLFHSRTPLGEKFGDWLMEEVLPSIRTNGFYYGRRFADLLHRSLQADRELEAGTITPEEAEAVRKAFYEEVELFNREVQEAAGEGRMMVCRRHAGFRFTQGKDAWLNERLKEGSLMLKIQRKQTACHLL